MQTAQEESTSPTSPAATPGDASANGTPSPASHGTSTTVAGEQRTAWHCVRAQPKHEHIAAAHLRRALHLEVFNPQLRIRRATRRGAVWFLEALFPGYIFARFDWAADSQRVRGTQGVSTLVTFGSVAPVIPDAVIDALRAEFNSADVHEVPDTLQDGDVVTIAGGAFHGLQATVLRVMTPTARVQVLLEILGGATKVEIPIHNVTREEKRALGPRG